MTQTIQLNTSVNHDLYDELQFIAKEEDQDVQSVIEQALTDFVSNRKIAMPREEIMKLYETSLERYTPLYERFAK